MQIIDISSLIEFSAIWVVSSKHAHKIYRFRIYYEHRFSIHTAYLHTHTHIFTHHQCIEDTYYEQNIPRLPPPKKKQRNFHRAKIPEKISNCSNWKAIDGERSEQTSLADVATLCQGEPENWAHVFFCVYMKRYLKLNSNFLHSNY